MTTLIISEKPSLTRRLLPFLPADLANDSTFVAHTNFIGPARFRFVRGRPMRDYPLIEAPQFELDSSTNYYAKPVLAYQDALAFGSAKAVPVPELMPAVTRIIYACDPDHSGAWAFRSALELWAGEQAARAAHDAWLVTAMDDSSLVKAIAKGSTTDELSGVYDYGRTKRYFEYQWINNAHVILGAAFRAVGGQGNRLPSKFGLQLLYALRQRCLGDESRIVHHMSRWPGTGKYPTGSMGSAASRGEIVAQLREMGLISKGEWAAITGRGEALLAALHPDCEDLDLPQRLDAWCRAGLEASQPAIDRYIRTVFGKQLRFSAKAA